VRRNARPGDPNPSHIASAPKSASSRIEGTINLRHARADSYIMLLGSLMNGGFAAAAKIRTLRDS
jgi:hypothetical protein